MAQYIYTMNKVSKIVPPKREILKDISLSFFPGAKIGVLGLNGAGKSTLLRIMAGVDKDFNGEARAQAGIKVGYLPQEPQLDPNKDVRGNVEDGVREALDALDRLNQIYAEYAEPDADFDKLAAEQGKMEDIIQAWDAHNLNTQLEKAADALRLPPWDADVSKLSGGEKRRVALCRLLLSKPDMLLLDEPTNHLDAESVAWLERFLKDYSGTIVAITHDRYFLDNVAEWILELDRGYGYPYKGNYTEWLEQKNKRLEQEQKQEEAFAKALKQELEWVRKNQKGQQAKSKSRLERFEEMNSKEFQQRNETAEIYIPPGPRLGNKVIEVNNISKSFGDRLLYENLTFTVPPMAIVGIVGPNGAGKTTTFYMVVGLVRHDQGKITIDGDDISVLPMHERARRGIGYLPQEASIFRRLTVYENLMAVLEIRKDLTAEQRRERADELIDEFNISHIRDSLGQSLSGGERRRVEIARALAANPKFILLDEPFAGVDPISVTDIKKIITDLRNRGLGVLITDHNVRETLDVCERAYIVGEGKIIATGTPEEVMNDEHVKRVYLGEQFKL